MRDHPADRAPVGAGNAAQSEPLFQNIGQVFVTGDHDLAVDAVVARHDVVRTRFADRRLEHRQVIRFDLAVAHTRRRTVEAALRHAVHDVMLRLRDNAVGTGDVVLLLAADQRDSKRFGQAGVLAQRFLRASPARFPRHVEVRRQNLVMTDGTRFLCDHVADQIQQFRIERLRPDERHR